MPTPPSVRSTVMATTSLVLLTLGSGKAVAAPIDLGNDVNVDWQNELFCAEQAQEFPELCSIPVFGAPRLVPDARNSGSSLKILVDFIESEVAGPSTLVLNVGDSLLNQILLPGTSTPLTLTYEFDFDTVDPLNLTLADFQKLILRISTCCRREIWCSPSVAVSTSATPVGLPSTRPARNPVQRLRCRGLARCCRCRSPEFSVCCCAD